MTQLGNQGYIRNASLDTLTASRVGKNKRAWLLAEAFTLFEQ
jgi:hypothetical protein